MEAFLLLADFSLCFSRPLLLEHWCMWLLAYAGTTAPSEHAAPSTDATMHGFFRYGNKWREMCAIFYAHNRVHACMQICILRYTNETPRPAATTVRYYTACPGISRETRMAQLYPVDDPLGTGSGPMA